MIILTNAKRPTTSVLIMRPLINMSLLNVHEERDTLPKEAPGLGFLKWYYMIYYCLIALMSMMP
jgi:hypothetical protein